MEQTNIDTLFAVPDRRMVTIRKWLRLLLAVHIVMLSFSVLRNVINFGKLYNWINGALDLAVIFCLLQLRKEHRLYILAAGLMIADLVIGNIRYDYLIYYLVQNFGSLGEVFLHISRIISYLPLVCSLGAIVAEYLAHRSLIKPYDAKLSQQWFHLMIANLAVSVLVSILGSVLASMIERGALSVITYQKYIFPLLRLPGIAVSLLYMVCLYKTERALQRT